MPRVSAAESAPSGAPEIIRTTRNRLSPFARGLYAFLFVLIAGTGLYFTWKTAADADARIRAQLLRQAREIALAIRPDLGRSLSFTAGEPDSPAEKRLRAALQAYASILKPRGIYTIAPRGGVLVFGVESYPPEDSMSSPSGTSYLRPPIELLAVLGQRRPDAVFGPVSDEYGTFVTAIAPVLDPRTREPILIVGVDLLAEDWTAAIRKSSRQPLWITAAALFMLGMGLALRNRERSEMTPAVFRTEPLFAAGIGILLTLLTTGLLHEAEKRTREADFDFLAAAGRNRLLQTFHLAERKMREAAVFYESRADAAPEEFASLLDPLNSETYFRFFAWIPEIHQRKSSPGPGASSSPPGLRPFVWPSSEATFVLDTGLNDPEVLSLFGKALEERLPVVSPPRPFPDLAGSSRLLYLVQYLAPSGLETAGWIRPGGWIVVGLDPAGVFSPLAAPGVPEGGLSCLALADVTRSLDAPIFIPLMPDSSDGIHPSPGRFESIFRSRSLEQNSPLFLFDRTYVITSHPTPLFLRTRSPRATQIAGIAGALFTLLLTVLVILLRHRQIDLERGILARTKEAREREENLSLTLHSIGDGVLVTDAGDRIIRMNPAAERWTEWPQADALGQPLSQVYRLDRSENSAVISSGSDHREPAFLLARGGRYFPVSDSVAPILSESGEQIGRIVVFRDISDLRTAQESLEQGERQYQLLFDGLTIGLALHEVLTGPDGKPADYRFLKINSAFEKLIGREAVEVVGRTVKELFPDTEPYWIESLGLVALTGHPVHLEHLNSAWNRYLEVDAYCPKPGQFAALVTDITDRRKMEEDRYRMEHGLQQKQRLESLGVLAGGIAHDFNNLLMVILGNTELIRQSLPAAAPGREPLQEISMAARTAADLCRQMLAYSGRGRYVIEPLDLNRVVREMEPILRTATAKGARLVTQLAPSLPGIEGDATQLRQIILNLTLNASEALPDGQGTITLSSGALLCATRFLRETIHQGELPEGLYVYLEVSDSGSGMPPEILARIFDPFFTTKFAGRGLGLAAVLGIVHAHHGAMTVTSEPGVGTSFKVFLPAVGEPPNVRTSTSPNLKRRPAWAGRKTVLLADPDRSVREVGRHLLEEIGVQAIPAGSGPAALERFRRHSTEIACALLDLSLNETAGDNWAGAILKIRPDLPILFSGREDLRQAPPGCPPRGQYGYLRKPYDINSLVDALNPLLVPPAGDRPGKIDAPQNKA